MNRRLWYSIMPVPTCFSLSTFVHLPQPLPLLPTLENTFGERGRWTKVPQEKWEKQSQLLYLPFHQYTPLQSAAMKSMVIGMTNSAEDWAVNVNTCFWCCILAKLIASLSLSIPNTVIFMAAFISYIFFRRERWLSKTFVLTLFATTFCETLDLIKSQFLYHFYRSSLLLCIFLSAAYSLMQIWLQPRDLKLYFSIIFACFCAFAQ